MIKAVGPRISFPISPAVVAGNIFFATNVPVDLQTGHFIGGPIETQTRQVLANLEALLKEAGGSLSDVAQLVGPPGIRVETTAQAYLLSS
jgi:enamine deaminase RidA (YjgF/YER057c/UK114 family)